MKRISILILVLFTFLASAAWPQAQPQWKHKIITFERSGRGHGCGPGHFPLRHRPSGVDRGEAALTGAGCLTTVSCALLTALSLISAFRARALALAKAQSRSRA